jgi:hypothetical protein
MTDVQQRRSWLWGTLFVAMGLLNITMYLYRGHAELQRLLTGVGLLLVAPRVSLRFPRGHMLTLGVAMLGLLLMVVGILAH